MRRWLLPYLCCPKTKEPLRLVVKKQEGGEILEGTLISASGKKYPIINGVPRFVKDAYQSTESVSSFGFEWNTLNFDAFYMSWKQDIAERNFGKPSYFKGKLVVECGAGSGMHTRWMLEAGAKRVIALELSQTVDGIMRKNLAGFEDRCAIIQADISEPPIRPRSVTGLVYCFNVIQHTKDPLKTTAKNLYGLLRRGTLAFNIYMTRGGLLYKLDPHRHLRRITTKMNKKFLLFNCRWLAALGMVPILGWLMEKSILIGGKTPKGKEYCKRKYKALLLNTYDYYGSHQYQYIYTGEQIEEFFRRWGLPKGNVKNLEQYRDGAPAPGLAILVKR